MGEASVPLLAFNRGIITKQAMARTDLTAKIPWAAEIQNNWMPRMLGSMMLRPGFEYTGATLSNAKSFSVEFVYANDDTARIEITDSNLRIWDGNDALVSRVLVSTVTTNGNFTSNITNWTDASETAGSSAWSDGTAYGAAAGGYLALLGTGYNRGSVYQQVAVAGGDLNKEHALRIVVTRGPLTLRVGSTNSADDYVAEVVLKTGTHSIALTPAGNFYIQLITITNYTVLVDSVNIEAAGVMTLPVPWVLANLSSLRYIASGQFTYVGCTGIQQREIIRRDTAANSSRSWSVQLYLPDDGPFKTANTTINSFTPSALSGDITVAALKPIFRSTHVGALFRLTSIGQNTSNTLAGNNQWSDPVKITGIGTQRTLTWSASSALAGTLTIQRSVAVLGQWADAQDNIIGLNGSYIDTNTGVDIYYRITMTAYTSGSTTVTTSTTMSTGMDVLSALNVSTGYLKIPAANIGANRYFNYSATPGFDGTLSLYISLDQVNFSFVKILTSGSSGTLTDGLDNQVIYYRMGFKQGNYSAGSTVLALSNSNGTLSGVFRVTKYTSSTSISAVVLDNLGGVGASANWEEGEWSDYRGWPSSPVIDGGRMWWFGQGLIDASLPDAYESFDPSIEGDSAVIQRSIGFGPVAKINWALSLERLVVGADGAEFVVRSSSLDELVTPTNFNVRAPSTRGSAAVQAVKTDTLGIYVHKNTQRVFGVNQDGITGKMVSDELTKYCPDLCTSSITRLAVQTTPDIRIHAVFSDGTGAVLIYNEVEDVKCWVTVSSPGAGGLIEDVVILPGTVEDKVYYTVKRTVNGGTVRYHERWALESACQGGTLNKQADAFVYGTQAASTTIGGLTHLIGATVVAWYDGTCPANADGSIATFVVNGAGQIVVPTAAVSYVVGLAYSATYKSTKLAYGAQRGTALTKMKRVNGIAPVLYNTHNKGLQYGRDFSNLMDLNSTYRNLVVPANMIYTTYDDTYIPFPGDNDTDSRLCMQANAPRPCTVLGTILDMSTSG